MYEGQTLKRNFIDKMIAQNDRFFNKIILQNKKDMAERLQVLQNSNDEKWLSLLEKKLLVTFSKFLLYVVNTLKN